MDPDFMPAMAAIYLGQVDELRRIIAEDPTLATRRSSCGHPTLLQFVAVDAGLDRVPSAVEAAAVLVEAGAALDEPLVAAASTDAREVLSLLLESGASLTFGTWKPLDEALYWSHSVLAETLVERGAPVDSLRVAAGLGDVSAMEIYWGDDGLRESAGPVRSAFEDTVPPTLANDPQQILDNAFVTAVLNDRIPAARWLLERGAQVNAKPCGFHWRGAALHAAIWRNRPDTVAFLIEAGADPGLRDDAYDADALGWAEHHGHDGLANMFRDLAT